MPEPTTQSYEMPCFTTSFSDFNFGWKTSLVMGRNLAKEDYFCPADQLSTKNKIIFTLGVAFIALVILVSVCLVLRLVWKFLGKCGCFDTWLRNCFEKEMEEGEKAFVCFFSAGFMNDENRESTVTRNPLLLAPSQVPQEAGATSAGYGSFDC